MWFILMYSPCSLRREVQADIQNKKYYLKEHHDLGGCCLGYTVICYVGFIKLTA